jgi:hypothetical protein
MREQNFVVYASIIWEERKQFQIMNATAIGKVHLLDKCRAPDKLRILRNENE